MRALKNVYGESINTESLHEELACDFGEQMFRNEKTLSEFIKKDRTLAEKVKDVWFKVLSAFSDKARLRHAQNLWAKAYREATGKVEGSGESFDGVKLKVNSDNKSIAKNIKNVYNKKSEQYGTMWTIENNILSRGEIAAFYSKISEMKNNGYRNYKISSDGEYIFDIGNKSVYTNGNFDKPIINSVVTIDTDDGTILQYAKEVLYDEVYDYDTAVSIIEALLGEGSVNKRNYKDDNTGYERSQNGARKGTNGTAVNNRSGKNVDKQKIAGVKEAEANVERNILLEENKRLRDQIENMHIQLDQAEGKGLDLKSHLGTYILR